MLLAGDRFDGVLDPDHFLSTKGITLLSVWLLCHTGSYIYILQTICKLRDSEMMNTEMRAALTNCMNQI